MFWLTYGRTQGDGGDTLKVPHLSRAHLPRMCARHFLNVLAIRVGCARKSCQKRSKGPAVSCIDLQSVRGHVPEDPH